MDRDVEQGGGTSSRWLRLQEFGREFLVGVDGIWKWIGRVCVFVMIWGGVDGLREILRGAS